MKNGRRILALAITCLMLMTMNGMVYAADSGTEVPPAEAPAVEPAPAAEPTVEPSPAAEPDPAPEDPQNVIPEAEPTEATAEPAASETNSMKEEVPAESQPQSTASEAPGSESAAVTPLPTPEVKYVTNFTVTARNVTVTAVTTDAAKFPEGTQLHVDYAAPDSALYQSAVRAVEQSLGIAGDDSRSAEGVVYDIYFTYQGARIEPDASVSVTMDFASPVTADLSDGSSMESSCVMHVKEGQAENVGTSVNTTPEGAVTDASFRSASFSPFFVGGVRRAPSGGSNRSGGSDVSAYVHASITCNNDTFESGITAVFSVKYVLEQNKITAGDYALLSIPADIADKVSFSLNGQHFSGYEDLGTGQYKLIFTDKIESGLSGSFHAYVTVKADKKTTGTVTIGDASKTVTVIPGGSSGGSGVYTDTIMKDAADNAGVSYGGYDYSEGVGDNAAQIGLSDLTNGEIFKYRLYINRKQAEISNVTVMDTVPDGMTIDQNKGFEVIDSSSGGTVSPSLYSIEVRGQTIIFAYPGTLKDTIQVHYWVDIPEGSNASKFTNTATVTYTQDGDVHQEHRNYVLQGYNNSASNGEKSVDKSIISTDPDDQFVTYTIKFWNHNGFSAGEINLTDNLDSHVKFVSADPNEYFSVTQDSADPQKIKITNIKDIQGSLTTYVRFMVNMQDVPVGYTVLNTVGGNTTKTTKYDGGLTVTAKKVIDQSGTPSDGQFSFQLLSSDDKVIQTKKNDQSGNVTFGRISYTKDDVGQTYTYKVREAEGDDTSFHYDPSAYHISVTPELEYDDAGNPTGKISANPVIKKGSETVSGIVFDNTTVTKVGSLKIVKTTSGATTPADTTFTITGLNYSETVKYSEFSAGSDGQKVYTLKNLPVGEYTVTENTDSAAVANYTLTVTGNSQTAKVRKDSTPAVTITNRYSKKTGGLTVSKTVVGGDTSKAFTFTVTLDDKTISGTYGEMTFNQGVATFQLKDGGEKKADGLPFGIGYEVTEAPAAGYTQAATGEKGAIVPDSTLTAAFTNTYGAKAASVALGGMKMLQGYPDGAEKPAFRFVLKDKEKTIGTAATEGEGIFSFDPLTFEKEGNYEYTVSEQAGTADGITYDRTVYTVTVTVTDDKAGQLTAKAAVKDQNGREADADKLNFTNKYKAAPAEATLTARKTLNGAVPADKAFTFTLTDATDAEHLKELQTAANDGKGAVTFKALTFDQPGEYHYQIRENAAAAGSVVTDEHVWNAQVSVTDDGSGKLKAAVTYGKDSKEAPLFRNRLTLKASKTDLTSGAEVKGAKITVYDADGKAVTSWTSDGTEHDFGPSLEAGKTYTIAEDSAPAGYAYVNKISLSVGQDGKMTVTGTEGSFTYDEKTGVLTIQDEKLNYQVEKVGPDGKPLSGAVLKATDSDGKEVDRWTSDGKAHALNTSAMEAGRMYTLTEETAPSDYQTIRPIEFELAKDGSLILNGKTYPNGSTIRITDQKVTVSKPTTPTTPTTPTKPTTGKTGNVKTGDTSNAALPLAAGSFALLAIALVLLGRKRRKA